MSRFMEQLSQLVSSSDVGHDAWFEAALNLYLTEKSQKSKGLQKYVRDIQLLEDLTLQINQVFKDHIKKVLMDEESTSRLIDELKDQITELNQSKALLEQQFEALNGKFKSLQQQETKNQEIAELLQKTIEDKDKQLAHYEKMIRKFEESPSQTKTEEATTTSSGNQSEEKSRRGRKSNKEKQLDDGKNQQTVTEINGVPIMPLEQATVSLAKELDNNEQQVTQERRDYGPTIKKEDLSIDWGLTPVSGTGIKTPYLTKQPVADNQSVTGCLVSLESELRYSSGCTLVPFVLRLQSSYKLRLSR